MKYLMLSFLSLCLSRANKPIVQRQTGFAVVELFTSQGCSSCPAADKNLNEIVIQAEKEGKEVYGLSFHVDYWNYIGWKDPYSNKEFTNRQRQYAGKLGLGNIYTPQMVINGDQEFVGSNRALAEKNIDASLKATPARVLTVRSLEVINNTCHLQYAVSKSAPGDILNIAVVEKNVENFVPRGENAGKKLHHENVVRFFTTESLQRQGAVTVPLGDINIENSILILYIQNKNWKVLDAAAGKLKS